MATTKTKITYGKIDGVGSTLGRYAVMTQEVPWNLVKDRIGGDPVAVNMISGLERTDLQKLIDDLPELDTIVGVGGGVAVDAVEVLCVEEEVRSRLCADHPLRERLCDASGRHEVERRRQLSRRSHARTHSHRLQGDPIRAEEAQLGRQRRHLLVQDRADSIGSYPTRRRVKNGIQRRRQRRGGCCGCSSVNRGRSRTSRTRG